jgi:hypothetical protein
MLLVIGLAAFVGPTPRHSSSWGSELLLYVSPHGDDRAAGTQQAPLRTLYRGQQVARELAKDMRGDVVVLLAAGQYRLDRTLEFTEADSGRNGYRVIYRSAAGPGEARLLGSTVLTGWQPYRDGIWKTSLPPKTLFHTLYADGRREHKARFPKFEPDPGMPLALGRYLVTVDGTPKQSDKEQTRTRRPGWLAYRPEDAPPVTALTKMKLHIFPGGTCDWVREIHAVTAIDPDRRRLTFDVDPVQGVGVGARFFLEDELGFLNAPGEFFVDEKARTLYYMPERKGHPDTLRISYSTLRRLIQFQGKSRESCVERIVLDGLALEETDDSPPLPLWAYDGLRDGALIWMNNTAGVEIRNCHLRNGGRSGVLMIGHNVGNQVSGCWIEHMGLNGVSLCNRFAAPGGKSPTLDRCEDNRIHNTCISHVGELHTYAECVTAFNVSRNEVDHCRLEHSVRYAITVRGNTGPQYGPPITTPYPPARENHFHHISVAHCGQDGGDMGALHAATLNNPGGGSVNTFEQITVADSAATASMKDIPPNGIFLDWPKMAMDQVFRNVEIVRPQGEPFRSHGPDNAASAQTENVSWKPGFREERMDYEHIGLTAAFPAEFAGRSEESAALAAPSHLGARAIAYDCVSLQWDAVASGRPTQYRIARDGQEIGRSCEPRWVDRGLPERTMHSYSVAARTGDFAHFGPAAQCVTTTPADREPPVATGVRVLPGGRRVRVAFSEPVETQSAADPSHYRFEPALDVQAVKQIAPAAVELTVAGLPANATCRLYVQGIADLAAARNRIREGKPLPVARVEVTVRYPLAPLVGNERLHDASGGGGDAVLRGGAKIEPSVGPRGGAALVLDGLLAYAQGPDDLNLGPGDFTLGVWVYRENSGVILSKGVDFGRPEQWSFGVSAAKTPGSVALRIDNHYFATAQRAVKYRQWTHLAFVRQGNTGTSYVDGQPSGGPHDLSGIGPLVNDRPLCIGRREYGPAPMSFKGRVTGLTIWARALSPERVRQEAANWPKE